MQRYDGNIDEELLDMYEEELEGLLEDISADRLLLRVYCIGMLRGYVKGFDEGFENGRSGHALPCCEGY